jgi:hypothetical protein
VVDTAQDTLSVIELKTFIPAKDYNLSKAFYSQMGFTKKSDEEGVAYFNLGSCSFLLQDFYQQQLCENLMMHLLVNDAYAWRKKLSSLDQASYGFKLSVVTEQPWGMLDFIVTDPSGVLWRIGQNI